MNKEANDSDDVNEEVEAPSSREVEHSLEKLKKYSLFSENRGREIIFNFENLVIVRKSEIYLNSLLLMIGTVFSTFLLPKDIHRHVFARG